jgi:hypothetical protein
LGWFRKYDSISLFLATLRSRKIGRSSVRCNKALISLNPKSTALDGMKTACGATLIASQHTATVDYADEARSESLSHGEGASGPVQELGEDFDRYFVLLDAATGKPLRQRGYAIRLPDGSSIEGMTDAQGHTKLCSASESHVVELVVYDDTPPVRPAWDQI